MLYKIIYSIVLSGLIYSGLLAQEATNDSISGSPNIFTALQDNSSGGRMVLDQSPELHVLIDKSIRINEKSGLEGYRIQIYTGSGVKARDEAAAVCQEFMAYFPEIDPGQIYKNYQAPYFKVRIGDYRNKNEAFEKYHAIKKRFPSSYIVKSSINFPKLESPEEK